MKSLDISVVGFSYDEVEKFREREIGRLSIYPTLQLAYNHFTNN